jgi:N utilization substance protein A
MSLEEAQNLVMTARVMLGWVDPADLASDEAEAAEGADAAEEAEA